jgi:hypothetical protein
LRALALISLIAFSAAFLATPVLAIQVALGDTVPLSGSAPSTQTVYLFLTGPNLPVNGVKLNAITQRADQGQFTKVPVDSNDHWSYKWNTGNVGGRLDEGTYTVWVVDGPNDLSNLAHAEYRTISVTLGKPSLAVDTVQVSGAMDLTSTPAGATVMVNDLQRGTTPLSLTDLSPGSYRVTFVKNGYYAFTANVPVEPGRVSEVAATLVVQEPTTVITTPEPVMTSVATTTAVSTGATKAAGLVLIVPLAALILVWVAGRRQ